MLRIKFSAGRQFSTSKSASSPSAGPLASIEGERLSQNDSKKGTF